MFTATVIVTILLAALLVATAVRKLGGRAAVVATYARVGVPEHRLGQLAAILLAGAAGLLLGLLWAPLGIAAAAATAGYFLVAIGFHVRARDFGPIATPVVFELLAVAALVLRVLTA